MGRRMMEDDIYIGSFLDQLNLRFAPPQASGEGYTDGIEELAELQSEFQIFQPGRTFRDSARLLNLGGTLNARAKNRWYTLLGDFPRLRSSVSGQSGDVALVTALLDNFAASTLQPVHFRTHDAAVEPHHARLVVQPGSRAVHYMKRDFIAVSIPMRPTEDGPGPVAGS